MIQGAIYTRWSVMWKGKKGYMVEKKFDTDFESALEAFVTLKRAGKPWATLRSCNTGFAPPARIIAHEVKMYRVVRRNGKKYKKAYTVTENLMDQYNSEGKWWCPYCIQLREFYKDPDEPFRPIYRCPVCEISNRDHHVLKHNPVAQRMESRTTRERKVRNGRSTRRSRG